MEEFIRSIWSYLQEIGFLFVLGLTLAGFIHVFLSGPRILSVVKKPTFGAVLFMTFVAAPLPMCSCGVIPMGMALAKRNVAPGPIVSFLIAVPAIGIDSFLISYRFFGLPFTLVKLATVVVTALLAGILVNTFSTRREEDELHKHIEEGSAHKGCSGHHPHYPNSLHDHPDHNHAWPDYSTWTLGAKIQEAFRFGFHDLLLDSAPILLIGILIVSYLGVHSDLETLKTFSDQGYWMQSLIIVLLSLPLYMCSASAAPFGQALQRFGFGSGSILVYLVCGPATNLFLIGALWRYLHAKVLLTYLISIIIVALGAGYLTEVLDIPIGKLEPSLSLQTTSGFGFSWTKPIFGLFFAFLLLTGTLQYAKERWVAGHKKAH